MKAIDFLQSMGNSTDFKNKSAFKDTKSLENKPKISFKEVLKQELNNVQKEETKNETPKSEKIESEVKTQDETLNEVKVNLPEELPEEFLMQLEELGIDIQSVIQFAVHMSLNNGEQSKVINMESLEAALQSLIENDGQLPEVKVESTILSVSNNGMVEGKIAERKNTIVSTEEKVEEQTVVAPKDNNTVKNTEESQKTDKEAIVKEGNVEQENVKETTTKSPIHIIANKTSTNVQPNEEIPNVNTMEEVKVETPEVIAMVNKTELLKNELKTLATPAESTTPSEATDTVDLTLQQPSSNGQEGQDSSNKGESKFILEGSKAQQQIQQANQVQMAQKFADMLAKYEKSQIRVFNQNGNHHANISLRTAELGNIDIRLSAQKEAMSAHFIVSKVATKEMVEFLTEQLRDKLVSQGIVVDKITVSHEPTNSNRFFQNQSQQQQFQNQEQKQKQKKLVFNGISNLQQPYEREIIQYGENLYGNTSFEASV